MIPSEKPHNPMVNAGAILVLSLLLNLTEVDMSLAEKFDWVMNYFKVSLNHLLLASHFLMGLRKHRHSIFAL